MKELLALVLLGWAVFMAGFAGGCAWFYWLTWYGPNRIGGK